MGSKGKGGGGAAEGSGEHGAMEQNACKVQRLETSRRVEQLQVFQYCCLEGQGRSSREAGGPGSWIPAEWGGVGWGRGLECWVNVQNLGSH